MVEKLRVALLDLQLEELAGLEGLLGAHGEPGGAICCTSQSLWLFQVGSSNCGTVPSSLMLV